VFRRILSLLIACALVVPSVAWGAHLSGHAQLATPEATHTHHYDDEHEGALQVTVTDEQGSDDSTPLKGMTHDHGPSHSHASAFVAPDESLTISSLVSDQLLFDRYASVHALARGDTLLRPPRIA
jgi:hypothetical protein